MESKGIEIEYFILTGAFSSLLILISVVIMVINNKLNRARDERIRKQIDEVSKLINKTNETKQELIGQLNEFIKLIEK